MDIQKIVHSLYPFSYLFCRRLGDVIDKEGKTLLENEFEKIQSTIHTEPIIFAGTQSVNRQKNRYANIMPCKLYNAKYIMLNYFSFLVDKTRVKLTVIPGVDGSDYINGNFIEVLSIINGVLMYYLFFINY